MEEKKKVRLTDEQHHDPDRVDRQVSLFGVRVQEVEHDGGHDEENEAAHLWGEHGSVSQEEATRGRAAAAEGTHSVEVLHHIFGVSVVVLAPVDLRALVGESRRHPVRTPDRGAEPQPASHSFRDSLICRL